MKNIYVASVVLIVTLFACKNDDNGVDCGTVLPADPPGLIFITDENNNTLIGPDKTFQFEDLILTSETTLIPLQLQGLPGGNNAVYFNSALMEDGEDFKLNLNENETLFVMINIQFKTIKSECFDQRLFDVVMVNNSVVSSGDGSFKIIF